MGQLSWKFLSWPSAAACELFSLGGVHGSCAERGTRGSLQLVLLNQHVHPVGLCCGALAPLWVLTAVPLSAPTILNQLASTTGKQWV